MYVHGRRLCTLSLQDNQQRRKWTVWLPSDTIYRNEFRREWETEKFSEILSFAEGMQIVEVRFLRILEDLITPVPNKLRLKCLRLV